MDKVKTLIDAEKDAILEAMKATQDRTELAKRLGVSRATLFRRLKKHGLTSVAHVG